MRAPWLASALLLLLCAPAAAQDREGFRIDRFRPPPSAEDGLGMQYARTLGDVVPSVGLILDYAHAPLVARTTHGEYGEIISHRVLAHVSAALGIFDFMELHLRVPVAFTGSDAPIVGGRTFDAPDVVGLGDGTLGGSLAIFSEGRRGFSFGLGIEAFLPWGTATSMASDTEFSARAQLLAGYALDPVTISLMVGGVYRPDRELATALNGSELEYALGFLVPTLPVLDVLFEVTGAVGLREGQVGHANTTPVELMLGVRTRLGSGFSLDLGVGAGITQTPGVPDVRLTAGLRWTLPPPPPGDTDGDGFRDDLDGCPQQAEDVDGWQDSDGCIDPDDDGDGWMDEDDICPREIEDRDGFLDRDGCPDPDDDGDTVLDEEDRCPRSPGATFQRGCPQLMHLEEDRITLVWPIAFAEGSAEVPERAGGVLDEIAGTLNADPTGERWQIAVRAVPLRRDDGTATALARAQALVAALLFRGVAAERLDATVLPAGSGDAIEITALGVTTIAAPRAPPSRAPVEVAPPAEP